MDGDCSRRCAGNSWNWIRIIVGGIMLFIFTEALFLKKNTDHKKQEQKRVKEEYMQQLKKYQDELTAVCEKYQVE